jgi:hypothetical protein
MNAAAIFAILEKGLTIIPLLISAGTEVIPLIQRLAGIAQGGATGTVTQAELTALEADLDAALADFNTPMA